MILYILRHGQAGEGFPDEIRELTERGHNDLETVLQRCKERITSLDRVYSSPLVRAQQTAEIAQAILNPDVQIHIDEQLVPWALPADALGAIEKGFNSKGSDVDSIDDSSGSILLASHQPFVSSLIHFLTDKDVNMGTSSIAAIETEHLAMGCGRLLWVEHRQKN